MNVMNLWPLRAWRWVVSWYAAPKLGWSRRAVSIWGGGSLKTGERPQDLQFACNVLPEYPRARVVVLTISGFYPPGSAGNGHAEVIDNWVTDRINEIRPAALLFDLTGLDYVWGDSMLCLTGPLSDGIPTVYVAIGRTADALKSLFVFWPDWEAEKPQIFHDRGDALRYLEGKRPR